MVCSFEVPSSSFSCEMSIIQAKNMGTLQPTSSERYFIWLILSAGKDRHVQLETREVPMKFGSALDWNESFALQCSGSGVSVEWLKHQSVTFELWYRNKVTGLRRFLRTRLKLLGRVEAPWKEVFESPHLGIETWVKMVPADSRLHGCDDAPLLRILRNLSVTGGSENLTAKREQENGRTYYECCCEDCNGYIGTLDYYVFAIVAALDALSNYEFCFTPAECLPRSENSCIDKYLASVAVIDRTLKRMQIYSYFFPSTPPLQDMMLL